MQTQIDVNRVFIAQANGAVDKLDLLLVNFQKIFWIDPEPVVHGQSHPVEAPVSNPTEVVFQKHVVVPVGEVLHPVGGGREISQKVEPYHLGLMEGEAAAAPRS
jgi:hypothetical protein